MEISNINNKTREKVIEYLHKKGISVSRFAHLVDVYQPNLHVFLNGKSLSTKSIEKIWKFFESENIKTK